MTDIRDDIVSQGHGALSPTMFAVHSTANPGATARNHRDLWSRGYPYAVHLVSDWTEAIHCVPYDRLCWQVGNGNATCEGLEICEATNAADFRRGIDIASDVVAQRLAARGWGIDRMHPHAWFSRVYGGSDHDDPGPYFARFGYSWAEFERLVQEKLNGKDNDMVSQDDINAIANAVWNFDQNGTLMRDRVQGTDEGVNDLRQHVGDKVWNTDLNGVFARDRIIGIDSIQLPALQATITAQNAVIETLSRSLGADPGQIATAIESAVKAKLDALKITVTTESE